MTTLNDKWNGLEHSLRTTFYNRIKNNTLTITNVNEVQKPILIVMSIYLLTPFWSWVKISSKVSNPQKNFTPSFLRIISESPKKISIKWVPGISGNLVVKSQLPSQRGSSLGAAEPHP